MAKVTLSPGLNAACSVLPFRFLCSLLSPAWQSGCAPVCHCSRTPSPHDSSFWTGREVQGQVLLPLQWAQPSSRESCPQHLSLSTSTGHYPAGTHSLLPGHALLPQHLPLRAVPFPRALMKLPPRLITGRAGALWPVNPVLLAWLTCTGPAGCWWTGGCTVRAARDRGRHSPSERDTCWATADMTPWCAASLGTEERTGASCVTALADGRGTPVTKQRGGSRCASSAWTCEGLCRVCLCSF